MSETRPTTSEQWSKTVTRARTRGLVEVASSFRDQVRSAVSSRGRLDFLVRDTDAACVQREGFIFRAAGSDDASAYADQIGTDSPSTFRARLSDETSCYLVEAAGRIAHASWVTTAGAWTAEVKALVTPPSGSAYVYESFTAPELRGRGIYPFALRCICAELAARGLAEVWIGVEVTNVASVRAITKAGFGPGFSLGYSKRWGRVAIEGARGPRAAAARELIAVHPGV